MSKFGNDFVGQYSLSKTLRFELKPIGKTKEWLEKNDVFASDEERANNYTVIKELLDQYYRFYIEQSLKNKKLTASLVKDAYEAYCKQDDKKTENLNMKLRKEVAGFFNNKEKFGLKDYKNLLVLTAPKDKKQPSILAQWIDGNADFSPADKEKYIEAIRNFAGFTVYFSGYKQTRENMFVDEAKATAIAYRIVDQNMYRFFSNIRLYNKIAGAYKELNAQLKKQKEYFQPIAYCGILSQSAIDQYNKVLGQEIKSNDTMGINSIINEYRQKENIKARNLPTMTILYKQILSEGTPAFALEQIENEQEAIALAKESYGEAYEEIQKLKKLVKQNIERDNLSRIYIKIQDTSSISNALFGSWDIFRRAIADKTNNMGKKEATAFAKRTKETISLQELWNVCNEYKDGLDADAAKEISGKIGLVEYFNAPPELVGKLPIKTKETVKGYKENLDQMIASIQFYRGLSLYNKNKKLARPEDSEMFYNKFDEIYLKLKSFSKAYDKIRNFATKKPYSDQKFKLNFNVPTLLSGWDLNKETSSASSILLKDGKYYLAILNADNRKVLDLSCEEVQESALAKGSSYQKMQYKQISGANKMIPKMVFSEKHSKLFAPSDRIKNIGKNKLYVKGAQDKEALYQWIDFCKDSLKKFNEWNDVYSFKFKQTKQYNDVKEFYNDVDRQAYRVEFVEISSKYIDQLVDEGKLYLFQIYNKDFSDGKKKQGTDNLHTMYWKTLFSKENLAAIKKDSNMPIIKLNGEAEIFLRKASIKYKVTHPKNQPIENKNALNPEKTSTFKYDLIKDKRYTEDKMFFHCPITINFRSQDNKSAYNVKVNSFIENNKDVNIIGIDRGERHLLYYTVVNQRGEILEQGSLNNIDYSYAKRGKAVQGRTNYRELLDIREKERADSRIAWNAVENIKELKAGYLSQVVHKLALLMLKYNAVIALENLNLNFKRGRIKVEKQVYQKFEKAIIDKLNYLVFKDRKYGEAGSVSNGYQLTAPFESFEKLGRQTGCIYYVIPSYTSHIDPKTGFVTINPLKAQLHYESVEKAKAVMSKWAGVHYDAKTKVFVFDLDYTKFNVEMFKTKWKICTNGAERYGYNGKNEPSKKYNVTEELRTLFEQAKISFMDGKDILPDIIQQNDKAFWSMLLYMLRLTMQIRYTCTGTDNDNDYILSPVEYEKGKFFDSRLANAKEPQNADANGAYNIALKGLQMIRGIEDGVLSKPKAGEERNRWFKFMQAHEYKSM